MGRVHILEPTGYGGIFQHAVGVASLVGRSGRDVTLHTAREHEPMEMCGFELCACSRWPRRSPGSNSARAELAARWMLRTVPHVARAARPGDVVHIEGNVSGPLTLFTILGLRARGCRVVHSPHQLFSRASRIDEAFLLPCLRMADAVIASSARDAHALAARGIPATQTPLLILPPPPNPERIRRWRAAWTVDGQRETILFAGEVRRDKRLDLLIEAATAWPDDRALAVVGRDRGDWRRCSTLAERLGVSVKADIGYAELDDFVAAIAAADAVVAPYDVAGQSGVLAVARRVGTRTLSSDAGGLPELADAAFPVCDGPPALNDALDALLQAPAPIAHDADTQAALAAHLAAYGFPASASGAP